MNHMVLGDASHEKKQAQKYRNRTIKGSVKIKLLKHFGDVNSTLYMIELQTYFDISINVQAV